MFLPLSLAVPPSASTVSPVIGHADVDEPFVVEVRLDVIRIVKEDAAVFQEADVVLVAVLVKGDEEIGFVARGKNFAGADADLENRRPAGDGGRDRHVGHDVLLAAAGEPGEKGADGSGCRPANCPRGG